MGLKVVLNDSHSDYFATVLNTNGYIVLIHSAENYASVSSSNVLEVFPGQGEDSSISVYARVVDTDDSLKSFSPYGVGFLLVTFYKHGDFKRDLNHIKHLS